MAYVYIYCDPSKLGRFEYSSFSLLYEPFYVGKGTKNRDVSHLRLASKSNYRLPFYDKLRSLQTVPYVIRIASDMTNLDAFALERQLVEDIGRRVFGTGPLLNLRDGGSEYGKVSDQTRHRLSEAHKGQIAWNKGKKTGIIPSNKGVSASAEFRKKVSLAKKGTPAWNKGIVGKIKLGSPSVTTRERIRIAKTQTWRITTPTGFSFDITNLKNFCKINRLTYSNMTAVGRGLRKHHKYYTCSLLQNRTKTSS